MPQPANAHIKTACRKCGQHIEVPADYAGTFVPCPACGESIAVPEAHKDAPLPPSPSRTQRIHMPSMPPPAKRRLYATQPPRDADIPPTRVIDAYLVPVLLILVGITIGIVFGDSPAAIPWAAFLSLLVFVLLLGHLGAIAARLKTIEALLRSRK